jgi:Y-X(10)_GDL-associated radical SAM protein
VGFDEAGTAGMSVPVTLSRRPATGDRRPRPSRFNHDDDYLHLVPVHVVWEITLACNLKCLHCGSRAGRRRPDELSTEECLDVVEQLARLGTREVSLIGGEAYLRPDWTEIVRAVRSHGMTCTIQTGGRGLTAARLEAAVEAGLQGVGVSIDGLADLHDEVRGVRGSHAAAVDALTRASAAGLRTGVNTQIGPRTIPQLEPLLQHLIELAVRYWQVQLTVAMGNAVDNEELLLQPYQLLDLMPLLARLHATGREHGLVLAPGNNVGYFGPYEHLWRQGQEERPHWSGCTAGQTAIGLEADGTVKGCPSLPTVGYAGGNVRDLTLDEIWRTSGSIDFARLRSVDDLWGFCRTCYYADVCRAGCTWTSHSLLGRPGNNPYCHYRALVLAHEGMRERIVKTRDAPDQPFAVGGFQLVIEPMPAGSATPASWPKAPARPPVAPPSAVTDQRRSEEGRVPVTLDICRSCSWFVWPGETRCPFCGVDLEASAATYEAERRHRAALVAEVQGLIDEVRASHG